MGITSKIDEFGLAAWITIMVLAFAAAWPLGLVVLAYLAFSGRLKNWVKGGKSDMFKARGRWHNPCGGGRNGRSSGNAAFDEYKEETLKRLEDEQGEFHSFLDRLRQAKDKAEFDQFMADRRDNGPSEAAQA
jgi:hypothetical protein